MSAPAYAITQQYPGSFEQAVRAITQALKTEGFGILTQVDVQATLKQKLDVDYQPYQILGACNPPNAYKALQAEKEIGLLLPCNVIIYQTQDSVLISVMKPTAALTLSKSEQVLAVAQEVEAKLVSALEAATVTNNSSQEVK